MLKTVASMIAPDKCVVCGLESSLLHEDCRVTVELVPASCITCGAVSPAWDACRACSRKTGLDKCYFVALSDSRLRRLISLAKFRSNSDACEVISELMIEVLPGYMKDLSVAYVPTADSRVRSRGYDSSRLIARHVARKLELPLRSLLQREGSTRQVGSSRKIRLQQAASQYSLKDSKVPERVLLIDDIHTTGATLSACAKLLRNGGAKVVYGCVLIRTK